MSRKNSTISRIGQRRQVVIPKQVCESLGLDEGDFVEVKRTKGGVLIKPKKLVDPDDILSPEEGKLLRKAEGQMRRGEFITLDDLENELGNPTRQKKRKNSLERFLRTGGLLS